MKKVSIGFILLIVFVFLPYLYLAAQDTGAVSNFKYVVLHYDHKNNAAPDFQKFRENLEAGIKQLLEKNKVPVLRYQKEAEEKKLKVCDTLTCIYAIEYAQGLMLNARIKCSLTFTDCHKKEVFTASAGKMVGAVAGGESYLKVFAKLIKPGMVKQFKF